MLDMFIVILMKMSTSNPSQKLMVLESSVKPIDLTVDSRTNYSGHVGVV